MYFLKNFILLVCCINRLISLCKNLFNLLEFLAEASTKNSSKLNKFLHSEVNLLIQHVIVQDQDGQNNNILLVVVQVLLCVQYIVFEIIYSYLFDQKETWGNH